MANNKFEKLLNSKYYRFVKTLTYLLLLNIIFCLTSVLSLFVLFFPGLICLHTLSNRIMNDDDINPFLDYFKEIKKQWSFMWRLEVLGMSVVIIYAVLGYFYALYITNYQKDWFVFIPMIFLAVLLLVLLAILFDLLMYNNYIFDDTFKMMILKSALIARKKIGYTFLNLLIFAAFFAALFFFPFIIPFISFAFYIYIIELINRKKFIKIAHEESARNLSHENLFLPVVKEGKFMKKILVIGSTNMDYTVYVDAMPKDGQTINGINRFIQPGGKGSNQAIAILKAGGDVTFFGAINKNDADGKIIKKTYDDLRLKYILKQSDSETGNATIIVDKNSENRIIVVKGANDDISPKEIDDDLVKNNDIIVLQNEIPLETTEYILKKYYNHEIVYNPAPAINLEDKYFKYITYFIVNETELSFYGIGSTIEEKAKYLLKKGVKNVLVTIGKNGSLLFKETGQIIEANPFKVNSVDTVAAGDTYLGYFVASKAKMLDDKESMKLASKASAIAVTKKGAINSIPYLNEVENYKFKD